MSQATTQAKHRRVLALNPLVGAIRRVLRDWRIAQARAQLAAVFKAGKDGNL
jgi:hypothetical protein